MKKTWFLFIMLCFISSVSFATFRFNAGEGSWSDPAMWDKGFPPLTTSEELKITRASNICRVDSNIGVYTAAPRTSIANAESTPAKIVIQENGVLSVGEFRVGAGGATGEGSVGIAEQTGGSLSVNDLYVGRYGGSVTPIRGSYTISGGTLTFNASANGRLYVGAGVGGGYVEGTFTVVGNASTIQMDTLYVGSDGTNAGKGTLVFQVGASGVSSIQVTDGVILDARGASSITNLEISTQAATLADADIVLVETTGNAVVAGAFDAMNGGLATEGTEIILADNIYALTYQYASGGGTANDIALVYMAGTNERPHLPNPSDHAVLSNSPTTLSWVNPDPNDGVSPITCTVYFGTDPNVLLMDHVTLAPNTATAAINAANFTTYGTQPLTNKITYYWAVYVADPSYGPEPIKGRTWRFDTDFNNAPEVNAGNDQTAWLGKSGPQDQEQISLNATVLDDGLPNPPAALSYLWTQVDNGAPAVTIGSDTSVNATVIITARGDYEFMLTADDGEKLGSDTVRIVVGDNSCDASHLETGADYAPGDDNEDCIVDLEDFLTLIARFWMHNTDHVTGSN